MSAHVPKRRKIDEAEADDVDTTVTEDHLINVLPPEVVLLIWVHLSIQDKLSLRCVNRRMYSLLSESVFWKEPVRLMGRYKRKNPVLIRTLLQLCSTSDSVLRRLQLPYCTSRSNISYVAGCKNLERLSWGGGVGFTAVGIQKLLFSSRNVCNFPKLTHLEIKMKEGVPFPFDCVSKLSSLQHMVINDERFDAFRCISDDWIANGCLPPLMTLVTRNILSHHSSDIGPRLPPNSDVRFSMFHVHKRPLDLPFCDIPLNTCYGGEKVMAKVDGGQNDWPLIEISHCAGPDIFALQSYYSYCTLMYGTHEQWQSAQPFSKYGPFMSTVYCEFRAPIHPVTYFMEAVLSYCPRAALMELQINTMDHFVLLPQYFSNLVGLRMCFIKYYSRSNDFWTAISGMDSLQCLTIHDCHLPELDWPVPPNIRALDLMAFGIDCCILDPLSLTKFPLLQHLSIYKHMEQDDCLDLFESLCYLPHLVSLSINRADCLPSPRLLPCSFYPQLESLQWHGSFPDDDVVSQLTNLREFAVSNLTEADIKVIACMPRLDVFVGIQLEKPLASHVRTILGRRGIVCLCGTKSEDIVVSVTADNGDLLPLFDTELDRLYAPSFLDAFF